MGIFDDISSFFNPQRGYQDAANQLQQYYGNAQGFLNPFMMNGQNIFGKLMGQYKNLSNPVNLENQWASSYTMSPYAKNLQGQATQSGLDAASSMGLMGSSAALNNIQNSAGNIMQSDRQQYLNDLMDKYRTAVGLGQSIYGTGANAAGMMGNNAMNMGNNMAGMAYGEANAPGDMFGKLLGLGTMAGIDYLTGGMKNKTQ